MIIATSFEVPFVEKYRPVTLDDVVGKIMVVIF
jgi:exosome complex RNA-binding protein Rrp4